MDATQQNYLDMFNAVGLFYQDNQTLIDLVPARTTAFAFVQSQAGLIGDAAGKQSLPGTGVTLDKAQARETLNQQTYANLAAVAPYAKSINNNALYQQLNYNFSQIADVQDESIADWAQERLDLINPLVPLADYGVDAAVITTWQSAIDAYRPLAAAPRNFTVQRTGHTLNIELLIKETNDHLRGTLDKLMNVIRFSQPIVYNNYRKARVIVDAGKGHTTNNNPTPTPSPIPVPILLEGTVVDANTLAAISNATIKLQNNQGELVTVTDVNGHYGLSFEITEPFSASLTTEIEGYLSQSITVNIPIEGGDFTFNFNLIPQTP